MSDAAQSPMDAEAFVAWAMRQPHRRFELVCGEVVRMAAGKAAHARTKLRMARLPADVADAAGLSCEAFGDRMAVRVNHDTVYEPDGLLRCGARLDDDAVPVTDPVVVVEVASFS